MRLFFVGLGPTLSQAVSIVSVWEPYSLSLVSDLTISTPTLLINVMNVDQELLEFKSLIHGVFKVLLVVANGI